MPRPRKNDPSTLLNPILSQFAARIAQAVEKFTVGRIEKALADQSRVLKGRRGPGALRAPARCYAPGCKNIAAPRFGMFCIAEHKDLPKETKERYRALRLKEKEKEKNNSEKAHPSSGRKEAAPGKQRATRKAGTRMARDGGANDKKRARSAKAKSAAKPATEKGAKSPKKKAKLPKNKARATSAKPPGPKAEKPNRGEDKARPSSAPAASAGDQAVSS
jgi:hypothetical protein